MKASRIIPIISAVIIGVGLLVFANFYRDKPGAKETVSPSATAQPTVISQPATCQLAGEIKFINPNLYETKGAKISYQNVDDIIRQIFWKSSPDDNVLSVGPNLFEDLKVPNGEAEIGVDLRKNTNVKVYTLTASISYGQKDNQGVVVGIKEAKCSGSIKVTMP